MIPRALIRPSTGRGSLEATHMKLGVARRGRGRGGGKVGVENQRWPQ